MRVAAVGRVDETEAIDGAQQGPQVPPEMQKAIEQGQEQIQSLTQENQQLKLKAADNSGKLQTRWPVTRPLIFSL